MAKRLCDILMSLVAILLLAIPMAVIVLVIRLGSKGPAIFAQRRAGRDGKPFRVRPFNEVIDGTLFINPGYSGKPQYGTERSVAILHCDETGIRAEYLPL